jgi:hypothetical protein
MSSSSIGLSVRLLKINVKLLIGGLLRTLYSLSRPKAARPKISFPSKAKECYRTALPATWATLCCKWNRPLRFRDFQWRLVAWLIQLLHFLHEPEFVIVTARVSQWMLMVIVVSALIRECNRGLLILLWTLPVCFLMCSGVGPALSGSAYRSMHLEGYVNVTGSPTTQPVQLYGDSPLCILRMFRVGQSGSLFRASAMTIMNKTQPDAH